MDVPPDAAIDTQKQLDYWNSVDATPNGMLGGFEQVSRVDIQGSRNLFAKLRLSAPPSPPPPRVADCGAGIGRITKNFLSTLNSGNVVVDIVEPVAKFTANITSGEEFAALREKGVVGDVFNVGLEQWTPEKGRYWVIWNQWCVGHLTDQALVAYLQRCKEGVVPGGMIFVKENITEGLSDVFDELDSSVTRTDRKFRELFAAAGLKVVRTEVQRGIPKGLYPVRSYALQKQ